MSINDVGRPMRETLILDRTFIGFRMAELRRNGFGVSFDDKFDLRSLNLWELRDDRYVVE